MSSAEKRQGNKECKRYQTDNKEIQIRVLGLCKGDEPYVVTLSHGYDEKGKALYFHCAPKGKKIDFIRHNPRASLTIIEDRGYNHGHCEQFYGSVVMQGKIKIIESNKEKFHALNVLIDHLDKKPAGIKRSFTKSDLTKIAILKFTIEEMKGKQCNAKI